jgi:hypothetical protein
MLLLLVSVRRWCAARTTATGELTVFERAGGLFERWEGWNHLPGLKIIYNFWWFTDTADADRAGALPTLRLRDATQMDLAQRAGGSGERPVLSRTAWVVIVPGANPGKVTEFGTLPTRR